MVKRIIENVNAQLSASDSADSADSTPIVDSTPAPIRSDAVVAALADIAELETALAVARVGGPTHATFSGMLADAIGRLALAEADETLANERAAQESEAVASVQSLPERLRETALAAIMAEIALAFDPTPEAPAEAPAEQVAAIGSRRGNWAATLSPANRATLDTAANDPILQARCAALLAAYDADMPRLNCTVGRAVNTRFSGMVALAPSGAGVANAADYANVSRAMIGYLLSIDWPTKPSDGRGICESKWLASRDRYTLGGGVKSALACMPQSNAEIAQYPDGTFKFAYPNTAGVRFLRTDNAAWNAFVGAGATTPPQAPSAVASTPPTAGVPTPPTVQANAMGTLTATARCNACGASNIVGAAICRNAACASDTWNAS